MVEEKPFRVLLDLSELNINASKYVWMNVSPRELHNIEDFKNAVLRKLNFERRDIKLFVHDGLLPEDEKIIILRENDTIKIQYDEPLSFSSSFRALNASKISIDENNSNESELIEVERKATKKRKRKPEDADDVSEEAIVKSHQKKSKHSKSVSLEDSSCMNGSAEIVTEIDVAAKEVIIPNHPKEPENSFNIHQDDNVCDVEVHETSSVGNSCKKRKRKRHKKRKSKPEVMSLAPYNIIPEIKTQDASPAKTFVDNYGSIRRHIHFTSPTPNVYNSSVNLSNSNNKCLNTENICNGSSAEKSSTSQVNSTPTSEACYEQDSWNVSPMLTINESSKVSEETIVYKKSATAKKKRQSFLDYPSLNCLPSEGTHIAFKTLELDETYCPVVTPYKEGIVKKVNSKTDELYIELIQEEVKPGKAGKFEILSKDEVPSEEIVKDVTLKWTDLIEPRCVTN